MGLLHENNSTSVGTTYTPGFAQWEQKGNNQPTDRFFHVDWLGSTRYLSDSSGVNFPSELRYDACGLDEIDDLLAGRANQKARLDRLNQRLAGTLGTGLEAVSAVNPGAGVAMGVNDAGEGKWGQAALRLLGPAARLLGRVRAFCRPQMRPGRIQLPGRSWLEYHNVPRGIGHTLDDHVGRTDAQLALRLTQFSHLTRTSTFPNVAAAEAAISAAIRANRAQIRVWLSSGPTQQRAFRLTTPNNVVGRILYSGQTVTVPGTTTVVVLRPLGRGKIPDTLCLCGSLMTGDRRIGPPFGRTLGRRYRVARLALVPHTQLSTQEGRAFQYCN